ncbi:MAG: MBOAT family protein [Treponema sp.]|nr:MBOAT family protein [Treponema sp.]
MSLTSFGFSIFLFIAFTIYYAIPQKKRWAILLIGSYAFYAFSGLKGLAYIFITTLVSFWVALKIQLIQDASTDELKQITDKNGKKVLREKIKKQKKLFLSIGILFCFGLLSVLKYFNFIAANILSLFNAHYNFISFFVPLGISFYTFSITGYLFDVYYGKYKAERNFLHYALFVSYFPSLIQGPINKNNILRQELFEKEHRLEYKNTCFALQRILWGCIKKLVIADRASLIVNYIFESYELLPSYIIFIGLIFYSIELYGDFAGGIDIVLGASELFGIKLPENFRQPYFATSIADFWRRWHISLGQWMKDYIFYPFTISNTMIKFSKKLSVHSKFLAKTIPACLGNILVFLIVGIWHGAEWHFIWYGVFHGFIIAFSTLAEPAYKKIDEKLKIPVDSFIWRVFRIIRTFILVNLSCLFDDVRNMTQSIGMTKQLFDFSNFKLISNFSFEGYGRSSLLIILFFCLIWFIVSVLKEGKNLDIREKIASLKLPVRWIIYLALIFAVPLFQSEEMVGFMYAVF